MNSHYTYLLIEAGTLLFPLLFSFDKRVSYYKYWKAIWPGMFITAAIFVAWDIAFTDKGIWWFSKTYTLSYRLLGLPIEEWLFFLVIPYACCFIALCIDYYKPPVSKQILWRNSLILGSCLILFAILNYKRWYTLSSFGACGSGLLLAYFLRYKNPGFDPHRFFYGYAFCLIPFFIVNGLLTAIPVVLYNDSENCGIRIYTIPLEDIFYGMLLILGNVWGLRYRLSRLKSPF